MNNIQLYSKLSSLPIKLQYEVSEFIDFLKYKSKKQSHDKPIRISGKAKGLIKLKENFDDPIEGFNEYIK